MKEISMEKVEAARQAMLETVKSKSLTHEQKVATMANHADSLLSVLDLPEGLLEVLRCEPEKQCICDLFEGNAPMRPRYIIPDYEKFFREGSAFLQVEPPKDLYEAINALQIFYKHVPSVTNYPVYVGQLDTLLDPFVQDMDEELAFKMIKLFCIQMDRTILDSFAHANIGPKATKAGRLLLRAMAETKDAVPNLTLKYDEELTEDDFAIEAIRCAMTSAKPSFCNHKMYSKDFSGNYVIASCYNGLSYGGGAYTLVRLILSNIAKRAKDRKDFLEKELPYIMDLCVRYMDERIRFIVEESGFFENNFLAKEGFIHRDRFSAMFGLVGLAEAVNILLEKEGKGDCRFGHSKEATELGVEIMDCISAFNEAHKNPYCEVSNGHFLLHAQVGISTDVEISPGTRIPIGEEPENLADQMEVLSHFHHYFPSGTGDLFPIDRTIHQNPEYVLDIMKGAFQKNLRYLSFYSNDSDVIRITGYLVKKSEMDKLKQGKSVLQDTVALGLGAAENGKILERKVR